MIFLSVDAERALNTFHYVVFGVSSILNAISMICLIKETPPHQMKMRKYLLMTQMMVIVNGFYTDILFEPIPLFPALAGICTGLLCKAGVDPHTVLGGLLLTYAWLGVSVFLCCCFRHHTIMPEQYKLSRNKWYLLQVAMFLIPTVPPACYAVIIFDSSKLMNLTETYGLSWALDRGSYFIHERNCIVILFMVLADLVFIGAVFGFMFIFLHMFYVLERDNRRSRLTISKIRRSLIILFIQLFIPFLMLLLPGIVGITGLLIEFIPFELSILLMISLTLHPIVHNFILLGITPTYRNIIMSIPRKLRHSHVPTVEGTVRLRRVTVTTQHKELS